MLDEQMINYIVKLAVDSAINYLEDEKERARDRRLRNTKLLLKNYKNLKKHAASIRLEIDELDELLLLDALETDEFAVESIKRSKKRTLVIIKFIDKMLELYQSLCTDEKECMKYEILYSIYIAEERASIKALADRYGVTTRQIYKILKNSVNEISILLFGIDTINLNY